MTSDRQIESNKENVSRSTGPRTPGGKQRSRNNARRHGLATRIEDDPDLRGGIEDLTAILAAGSNEFERVDQARLLAVSHFDQRRIRSARYEIFLAIDDLKNACGEDFAKAVLAMDRISRYETKAFRRESAPYANCWTKVALQASALDTNFGAGATRLQRLRGKD